MSADALIYGAATIVSLWGVAHLIPTGSVVAGFGAISVDNRLPARTLAPERLREAVRRAIELQPGAERIAAAFAEAGGAAAAAANVLEGLIGDRAPLPNHSSRRGVDHDARGASRHR